MPKPIKPKVAIAKTNVAREQIPTTRVRTATEIFKVVTLSETRGFAANVLATEWVSEYAPVASRAARAAPVKLRKTEGELFEFCVISYLFIIRDRSRVSWGFSVVRDSLRLEASPFSTTHDPQLELRL